MRFLLFLIFLCNCFALYTQNINPILGDTTLTYYEIIEKVEKQYQHKSKEKHSGYKQYERWKYLAQGRLDQYGKVISKSRMAASLLTFRKKESRLKSISQTHNWQPLGPVVTARTSSWSSSIGRITSLDVSTTDPQKIIVGAASGGVWRTLDGGSSWAPISDDLAFLDITAVAISPHNNNHFIAGTASGGTYQTYDAGQTWTRANFWTKVRVLNILFDPNNPNVILAAGNYLSSGFFQGRIYRSEDGGQSWTYRIGYSHALYDLEFMPGNPNVVYAGVGTTVERSFDNGVTFTDRRLIRLPGITMVATTPADPAIVYRMRADDSGGLDNIYVSSDTGRTFQSVTFGNANNLLGSSIDKFGGQAPKDMDIVVSPTNPQEIIVGGVDTYRSTDGGANWTKLTAWQHDDPEPFIHADVDIMKYSNNRLYFGTDGGLFYTDDMMTFHDRSQGLNIRQFYKLGVSSTEQGLLLGGSQDNGGSFRKGVWTDYIGADGMEGYVSRFNANKYVQSIQRGQLYYSLDGGMTTVSIDGSSNPFGQWLVPLHEGPETGAIYHGRSSYIHKSTDLGQSWTQLVRPRSGFILDFDISESDEDVMVSTWTDSLYKTTDGGISWENITPAGEYKFFTSVTLHPADHSRILTTTSGPPASFYSADGGATWTDITYNIPLAGINQMIFEPNQDDGIFAASGVGVFYLGKGETIWVSEQRNIPAVDVRELEIAFDTIYAATYGRGMWSAPIQNVGEVYGCTDTKAHNYNPLATYDNGTCETCLDFYKNGDERGIDCGDACGRPCTWLVQHGFDFYDASLRWADSLAIAGDTVLFAYWLDNDTVKVDAPVIEIEESSYWKAYDGFDNISISNLKPDQITPLFRIKDRLTLDNLIITGKSNGGALIFQLANGASVDIKGGGINTNAEIQKE